MLSQLQPILVLTAEMLRTGEARSAHDDKGAAFVDAIGLNPFIDSDTYRFLLATTATPTRIGSAQITDTPIAYALDPTFSSSGYAYILGNDGRFYRIDTSGTVTVIRPQTTLTALSNVTGGMAGVVDSGGNAYVFLATRTRLIRWNLNTADSASHWLEESDNALSDTYHHPFHRHLDAVYFGNREYLGIIPLDSLHNQAGPALSNVNRTLVRLGTSKETITAIGDDGRYVVVAISPMLQGTALGEARIMWYSGTGPDWEWEVTIKGEFGIRAIERNKDGVFAIGARQKYRIAFGEQPEPVRPFPNTDAIGSVYNYFSGDSRPDCAGVYGETILFGMRGAAFGRRYPTEPVTFSHPLQGHTDDISLIMTDFTDPHIYVGTEDDKLWKYDMSAAGNTSNSYPTRWFQLNGEHTIISVEVELPEGVGASDVTTLTFTVPNGETATATVSQAALAARQRYNVRLPLSKQLIGSKVKCAFAQSAGTPKIGGITLYGTPTTK